MPPNRRRRHEAADLSGGRSRASRRELLRDRPVVAQATGAAYCLAFQSRRARMVLATWESGFMSVYSYRILPCGEIT